MRAAHCVYAACAISELEENTTAAFEFGKYKKTKNEKVTNTDKPKGKTKYIHVFPLAKKWLLPGELEVEFESELQLELELEELQQAR